MGEGVAVKCREGVLYPPLIQHNVESLIQNLGLRKLYLGVLAISSIDYGFTAHFGYLLPVAVECPATNLSSTHNVLNELDSLAKPDRELVKQFNVLEKIVIRVPEGEGGRREE